MGVWEKFDTIVTKEQIEEVSNRKFDKPKAGQHNVELLAVEATETSTGLPIVKFNFRDIDNRQFINSSMFLTNQYYPERTPQEINRVLAALRKLGNKIEFTTMSDLEKAINSTEVGGQYVVDLKYRKESDKYPIFEVISTLESPDTSFAPIEESIGDDDLPF